MSRLIFSPAPLAAALLAAGCVLAGAASAEPLQLRLRRLVETQPGSGQWKEVETTANWEPRQTAAILCDMWDQHWCRGATARVAEMAPRMNQVISELRRRGVLIIHCPSTTMKFYEGTPGRILAQSAPKVETRVPLLTTCPRDPAHEPPLPIDETGGGCDDDPPCKHGSPWRREIATLEILPGDAITDSTEAYYLMRQRGITNVIYMGVHQNICILKRPFGVRQMVTQGQNVVLIRDLTDSMYNSRQRPFVDHFTGNDLITWHIEKYWCPTMTSDQFLGGQSFRFAADTKPPRVFHNEPNTPQK